MELIGQVESKEAWEENRVVHLNDHVIYSLTPYNVINYSLTGQKLVMNSRSYTDKGKLII